MSNLNTRPATQKDVATRAGVSQAAVSAVFRGNTDKIGVSEQTRNRILKAVGELNYRPNLSARAMRSRRTFNIGLLLGGTKKPWKPDGHLCAALHDAASRQNFHVTLIGLLDSEQPFPPPLREACLDVLMVDRHLDIEAKHINEITSGVTPVLHINSQAEQNAIGLNEADAAKQLTLHLLDKGYKKVTYLSLEASSQHPCVKERVYGYASVVAEKWMHPHHACPGDAEPISWLKHFLAQLDESTGFICHNERDAAVLLCAALKVGLRIPADLGVTSIGLNNYGILSPFAITGIKVPCNEMADAAICMVSELSNPDKKVAGVESKLFKGTLELGETTPA